METKVCNICGQEKPVEDFSKAYKHICKECRNGIAREARKETQRIETPLSEMYEESVKEQRRWQILLAVAPAVIDPKHVVNETRVAFDACDIADAIFEEWSKREAKRKASGASK